MPFSNWYLGRLSSIAFSFFVGIISLLFLFDVVYADTTCKCSFVYKKIVSNASINDVPASDGPKFGYADLKDQCALDFKAFGNLVATGELNGKMCGGHCATGIGLFCPFNGTCHNDKDCGKNKYDQNLICEYGFCVEGIFVDESDPDSAIGHKSSYDVYSDNTIITEDKCNESTVDPSVVHATGIRQVAGNSKPCGGLCAAYFGIKCPLGQQNCKVNADCVSGKCEMPANNADSMGACVQTESSGPKNSDLAKKELNVYQITTSTVEFKPTDLDPTAAVNVDVGYCQSLAGKHPNMNPADLKKDEGEELMSVLCEAQNPPEEKKEEINEFVIPSTASLNKIDTVDPRILAARIISTLMGVLGSIALVMFIYGGILWMTDLGNAERETKAKHIIVWTALGLAVIFASYALLKIVFEAFK